MGNSERFEHIILGGGKGGKSLAMALAGAGHKVALIERGQIGGTCINQACIPTKTMVASAKLIDQAKHAADFGVRLQPASPSLDTVVERKRRVVKGMVDAHLALFTNTANMEFVLGLGRFVGAHEVEVTLQGGSKRYLTSDRIYINTGSKTTIPSIAGLDQIDYLTSKSVMELTVLPENMVILGGGYIALEFAQVFARLGSRVTVLLRGRFLPREDEDIAEAISEILRADGVEFKKAAISSVQKNADGQIAINLESETLQASHLLLAVGRSPNTAELNLEAAGVETDANGNIKVNESLLTNAPGIWAIGDCNGGPLFTHVSWDDYRIIKDNVLHNANRTTTNRLVPYTLFIDPELGRVGITEQEARKQGLDVLVAKVAAAKIPRANTAGETKGLLKAVIDKKSHRILGCSLLCHSAGEVMSVVQMAMIGNLPYTLVRDTIFTHPTMAESLNILLASVS